VQNAQSALAGILTLLTTAILATAGYLAFVFPKTVAIWEKEYEGRSLSALQILVGNASHFCVSYGMALLPLLLLGVLGSLVWLISSMRKEEKGRQQEHGR